MQSNIRRCVYLCHDVHSECPDIVAMNISAIRGGMQRQQCPLFGSIIDGKHHRPCLMVAADCMRLRQGKNGCSLLGNWGAFLNWRRGRSEPNAVPGGNKGLGPGRSRTHGLGSGTSKSSDVRKALGPVKRMEVWWKNGTMSALIGTPLLTNPPMAKRMWRGWENWCPPLPPTQRRSGAGEGQRRGGDGGCGASGAGERTPGHCVCTLGQPSELGRPGAKPAKGQGAPDLHSRGGMCSRGDVGMEYPAVNGNSRVFQSCQ